MLLASGPPEWLRNARDVWVDAEMSMNGQVGAPDAAEPRPTLEWTRRGLTPLMRLWHAEMKTTLAGVPRPFDDPHASAPGRNSDRILLFGAGLSVGWGVITHDLALPGFLARTLSSATGRGTDVYAVVDPDIQLAGALRQLNAMPLWRYDAIVIVLGVNEALSLTPVKKWRARLSELVTALTTSLGIPIVIAGIQTIPSIPVYNSALGRVAGAHAVALNVASDQICAAIPLGLFVPLTDIDFPTPGRHRSPDTYAEAARLLAAAMAPVLNTGRHEPADPHRPFPEPGELESHRQAAVDAVDFSNVELLRSVDQILSITQLRLQVETAALTVLDHDKQRMRVNTSAGLIEAPRLGSFCEAAVRQRGELLVPDALQDERFRDYPLVAGEPHIRFYAGYPLESLSGERLGALCVFDTEPRNADDVDLASLRDLALLVQRELRAAR